MPQRQSPHASFCPPSKWGWARRVFSVPVAAPGTSSGFKRPRCLIYLQPVKSKPPFQALSLSILWGFDVGLASVIWTYLKSYLAVLGLNCSKQNLLVVECGIYLPDQGSNLGPLHWEPIVLTTGPPGKSLSEPSWTTGKRYMNLKNPRFKFKPCLSSSFWPCIRCLTTQTVFLYRCSGKNKMHSHHCNFAAINNINYHLLGTCCVPCPAPDPLWTWSCLSFCPLNSMMVGVHSPT